MKLFIQIKDGKPFEHPIFLDNFQQAFPAIDINNLPPEFANFERIPMPEIGEYEVYEGVTYEWLDGVVKDLHHVRPMTQTEINEKQQIVKECWAKNGFESWLFDEQTCSFKPPVTMPTDGKMYSWDEQQKQWTEAKA